MAEKFSLETWLWIGALGLLVALWFVFVSPRLVTRLARTLHHDHDQNPPPVTFVDKIALYIASLLMFAVAVIVAIMFYEVILRYFFGKPTLWVEELSRWLGGVIFLLAGGYAMQQRSHIRVVIVYDLVSRRAQRIFDVIATLCILTFCYAVTVGYARNAWKKLITWELYGSAWNPPIPAVMKPLIVISVVLLALQAVNNLIVDWRRSKETHGPSEDL